MQTLRIALALIGALAILCPSTAHAGHKKPKRTAPEEWEIVYTTTVARADNAPGGCEVKIGTNGREWPRPGNDYQWTNASASCLASGLAVHDNVTRNNAAPNQL